MFSILELVDILAKASGQGGELLSGDKSHSNHAQVTAYAHAHAAPQAHA